jgi:hypothetical protein
LEFKCLIFSTPFNVESCLMMTQKKWAITWVFQFLAITKQHLALINVQCCSKRVRVAIGSIFFSFISFFSLFLVGCGHLVVPKLELGCDGKNKTELEFGYAI